LESEDVGNLKGEFTKCGGRAAKIESLAYSSGLTEGANDSICNGGDSDGTENHIGSPGNGKETARQP
jgi:hypothetical protein